MWFERPDMTWVCLTLILMSKSINFAQVGGPRDLTWLRVCLTLVWILRSVNFV